ncbi:MAG TPA: dTDP-4-dehydrorhamnose 3,5-epimerase [Candidatus Kapabacteria bacterium]|nr:dTDP-4-dehydrorhamnose 3,5-epimerase [Candidatus Kapabacteria bacterium]
MQVIATALPDVLLLKPRVFADERGYFMETWNQRVYAEHGLDLHFVQDNHSRSHRHTLRGLHYQVVQPQGKLVSVSRGEVYDVVVDVRKNSPTFGQWAAEILSEDNHHLLWIPPGFAHGFYVLSEVADIHYKCTDFYAPEHERCIRWDDPALAISWPIEDGVAPRLSVRDGQGVFLSVAEPVAC